MTRDRSPERAELEKLIDVIPTNWCDSLLTGPDAAIGKPPYGCPDIERLLLGIKQRLSAEIDRLRAGLASSRDADDRLLMIAGLVNAYHNDGTTLSAAETLRAIADALGQPFDPPSAGSGTPGRTA